MSIRSCHFRMIHHAITSPMSYIANMRKDNRIADAICSHDICSFVLILHVHHPVRRGRRALPPKTRKVNFADWGDCLKGEDIKMQSNHQFPGLTIAFLLLLSITDYLAFMFLCWMESAREKIRNGQMDFPSALLLYRIIRIIPRQRL